MQVCRLVDGVPGALRGDGAATITMLTADSRRVEPGALFVCLHGTHTDGHRFLAEARARGAVAALVGEAATAADWPASFVAADVRAALASIAPRWFGHPERALTMIGITGTNGKTTTTHLIESIEAARNRRTAVVGTIAYRIGGESEPAPNTTPELITLLGFLQRAVAGGALTAAMEISSHALDQRRVEGIALDAAVFTNLTRDHLDYHHDMETYYRAKRTLFALRRGAGAAVLNLDDPYGARLADEVGGRIITFSTDGEHRRGATVAALAPVLDAHGSRFTLRLDGATHPVTLPLAARFNIANALAAAAAAHAVGVPAAAIVAGLTRAPQVAGRLERVPVRTPFTMLVDYAHTPDALEKVIAAAREFTAGKLITVFGCGGDRDRTKRPLMGGIAGRGSDLAVVTSDNPRTEPAQAIIDEVLAGMDAGMQKIVEPDRRRAIAAAVRAAAPGDTILIAGKGHEDYQIIGTEKIPFSDVQVAAEEAKLCNA
ncbi:MAG TPA: UDP-N-acetylmuramoyl-L-alanyl-D-glutamate--2,6-diaminopimelate ligase [bacterium]|nr:UDP-N-acetylmuramoyl-L-alanyl-D-glutamate--2,6-diaminopimelate ligase [bacterium]